MKDNIKNENNCTSSSTYHNDETYYPQKTFLFENHYKYFILKKSQIIK